jgi:diguanylate cyclase (GGDEF)-like protein
LSAELDRSRRYKRPFTLAYIDLDNFKIVNDSLGHGAGDEVLQTVVAVMREQIRRTDVVARLGGDEFALLLPETDLDAAHIAIEKIRSSLLLKMSERHWPVTASIGSLTCRDAQLSVDQLIKQADDLMYVAKSIGKNTASFSPASGS